MGEVQVVPSAAGTAVRLRKRIAHRGAVRV